MVTLTNVANGAHMTYAIVSPHEANMSEGKISLKSPIAQALLNHQAGDTVDVSVPAGKITLRIDEVTRRCLVLITMQPSALRRSCPAVGKMVVAGQIILSFFFFSQILA